MRVKAAPGAGHLYQKKKKMKDVTKTAVSSYIDYEKILLSAIAADGRHSFNGLSKLVSAQLNYAPKQGEAYLFLVKNRNDRVKVLTKTAHATNVAELGGEKAKRLVRICTLANRLKTNAVSK